MIRTQVQFPDELYQRLKRLAEERELSLAEVLRRGAEYMLNVYPPVEETAEAWRLPEPRDLGGHDPCADPDWREKLHMAPVETLRVAEKKSKWPDRKRRT